MSLTLFGIRASKSICNHILGGSFFKTHPVESVIILKCQRIKSDSSLHRIFCMLKNCFDKPIFDKQWATCLPTKKKYSYQRIHKYVLKHIKAVSVQCVTQSNALGSFINDVTSKREGGDKEMKILGN